MNRKLSGTYFDREAGCLRTEYVPAGRFLTFLRDTAAGIRPAGMFEGRGPLAILLLVFFGGLALNLTPCVLPLIPINLAIIGAGAAPGRAGAQPKDKSRGFILGLAYGAAMAVVYGVLTSGMDSTAGERERGSLEPLLMTPVQRGTLVMGKWLAVSALGLSIAVLWMRQSSCTYAPACRLP